MPNNIQRFFRNAVAMCACLLIWAIGSLSACSSATPTNQSGAPNSTNTPNAQSTAETFVEGVCRIASACSHITTTQADIDACPADLSAELTSSASQTRVSAFGNFTQAKQDCALDCMRGQICSRFGVSILSVSDSDALDPLTQCEPFCDGRVSSGSTIQLGAADFPAEVCALGAICDHVTPTQADRNACPAELAGKLTSASSQNLLAEFAAFPRSKQDCTLSCMGPLICPRFGVTILAISDNDALEPMQECADICDQP